MLSTQCSEVKLGAYLRGHLLEGAHNRGITVYECLLMNTRKLGTFLNTQPKQKVSAMKKHMIRLLCINIYVWVDVLIITFYL